MAPTLVSAVAASALLIAISVGGPALAQKHGGILRIYDVDSPAEHVDPRGDNGLFAEPDDGRIQQPDHV
jgi:hypothetical protein